MPMTTQEFAQKIKQKYPQYKDWEDTKLINSIVQKFPMYKSWIDGSPQDTGMNQPDNTKVTPEENKPGILEKIDKGFGKVFEPVSNFLFGSASKIVGNTIGQGVEAVQGKEGVFTKGFNEQFGDINKALQGQGGSNLPGTAKNIAGLALDSTIGGFGEKTVGKIAGKLSAPLIARAEKLYQSALKPTAAVLKKSPDVVKTGIKEGIRVSESGYSKLKGIVDDISEEIANVIDNGVAQGKVVQKSTLLPYVDELKDYLGNSLGGKQLVKDVDEIAKKIIQDLPDNIPVQEAQKIKQTTYKLVNKYYGAMAPIEQETKKQLARGLKEQIANVVPEINQLNARDSKLIQLEDTLERAVGRINNRNVIAMNDVIAFGAGMASGDAKKLAIGIPILRRIIESPAVKSQSAIWLNKLAENGAKLLKAGRYPAAITVSKILQLFSDDKKENN